MPDVREVYEMVTKQSPRQPNALDRQLARQARATRNRKIGAIALSFALIATLAAYGAIELARSREEPASQKHPSPSTVIKMTPPIGAQLIGLDGAVVQQISRAIAPGEGLRISPDGSTIAFYGMSGLTLIGTDGTDERVLAPASNAGDAKNGISWSPDGSQIAYASNENIWIVNADGSDRHRLTHATSGSGSGDYYPAWSPDGSTIAYWHGSGNGPDGGPRNAEIYTVPVVGGTPTRLTHDRVPSIEPAWSPDGRYIVYRRSVEQDLVLMRADGSHADVVSPGWSNPWAPAWSPDGSRIAFLNCCADHRGDLGAPLLEVDVLNLATGRVVKLHVNAETDLNGPSWMSNDVLLVNRYD